MYTNFSTDLKLYIYLFVNINKCTTNNGKFGPNTNKFRILLQTRIEVQTNYYSLNNVYVSYTIAYYLANHNEYIYNIHR